MIRGRYATDAAVAAVVAVTQVIMTDNLNGATLTGTDLITSATPTVDELETAVGVLGGQLNAALVDAANIKTEMAGLRTKLGI